MTELLAAAAAFLLAALCGKPLANWLSAKGFGRSLMVKKGESVTPGQVGAPEFGALPLLAGFIPASILALLILLAAGGSLSPGIDAGKLLAVLFSAALFAAAGLMDDWRRGKRLPELPLFARVALILGGSVAFLVALRTLGETSNIVLVPFWGGQADLGSVWFSAMVLLITGAACGGDACGAVSGEGASASLPLAFASAGVSAVFGARGMAAAAFAHAGAVLGLLLYAFPPEKMREGRGGRMLLGAAPVLMAIAAGAPLFVLPAGAPFMLEGAYAVIRIFRTALGKKPGPGTLGGYLLERGWPGRTVSGLYALLGFIGAAVSVGAACLYLRTAV